MSGPGTLHKRANSSSTSTSPRVNLEMASMMQPAEDSDSGREGNSVSPSSSYSHGERRPGRISVDADRFGSERGSMDSEEDRAALLGGEQAHPIRKRAGDDTWGQVKEIVIEVCYDQVWSNIGYADEVADYADTLTDDGRIAVHGRAVGPCLGSLQSCEDDSVPDCLSTALGSHEEDRRAHHHHTRRAEPQGQPGDEPIISPRYSRASSPYCSLSKCLIVGAGERRRPRRPDKAIRYPLWQHGIATSAGHARLLHRGRPLLHPWINYTCG